METSNINSSQGAPETTTQAPVADKNVTQQMQNLGKAGVDQFGAVVSQFAAPFDTKGAVKQPPVTQDEKIYATIAYIPVVTLLSIIVKPDSAYVRLHAKQGLLLFAIFFFVLIFSAFLSIFGVVGQFLAVILGVVPMGCFVLGVYSMYLAMVGYWWKIPVLASIADLIPIEAIAKVSKENITGQIGVAKNDYDNRQDVLTKEAVSPEAPKQPIGDQTAQK